MSNQSVLVKYFKELSANPEAAFPSTISQMEDSSMDFEANRLCEYVLKYTNCKYPYLMDDLSEKDIIPHFDSENDDVRVSAVLSIINLRIPALKLHMYIC